MRCFSWIPLLLKRPFGAIGFLIFCFASPSAGLLWSNMPAHTQTSFCSSPIHPKTLQKPHLQAQIDGTRRRPCTSLREFVALRRFILLWMGRLGTARISLRKRWTLGRTSGCQPLSLPVKSMTAWLQMTGRIENFTLWAILLNICKNNSYWSYCPIIKYAGNIV